jgi:hypothetical protein
LSYLGRKLDLGANVIKEMRDPVTPLHSHSRPIPVWLLISLQFLLGLGAVISGGLLILGPDGHLMQMPLAMLKTTPFSSFLLPAILLFTVIGLYPLAVAYCLFARPAWSWPHLINPFKTLHWAWAASLAVGVAVLIWIGVQMVMLQAVVFLHVLYIGWGLLIIVLTLHPKVRAHLAR